MLQMHHWIALLAVHLLSCVVRDSDKDRHLFVDVHVVQLAATTEVPWNIKTRLDHPTAHDVVEHAELDLHTMPNGNKAATRRELDNRIMNDNLFSDFNVGAKNFANCS